VTLLFVFIFTSSKVFKKKQLRSNWSLWTSCEMKAVKWQPSTNIFLWALCDVSTEGVVHFKKL